MKTLLNILKKALVYTLVYNMILMPMAYAEDGIVVDTTAPKANQSSLDKSQNGMDIVSMAKPTNSGVSHNKFMEYNVKNQA